MNPGPWVPGMERVRTKIYANEMLLSEVRLGVGYTDYRVNVPPPVAARLVGKSVDIRIESKSWIPKRVLNLPDVRRLGVMLDSVQLTFR